MKYLVPLFLLLFVTNTSAQNKFTIDEKNGKPMLIGKCAREDFQDTSFSWWWNSEYSMYSVDSITVKTFDNVLPSIKIKCVIGTWCSDSKREVPRFYKILDICESKPANLELICVNRKKESNEAIDLEGLTIEKVPTFIVFRDNKEIGRIIEEPKESLEKDLAKILGK